MSGPASHVGGTSGLITMQFSSQDTRVSLSGSYFTHPIESFTVDAAQNYEICMVSCTYPAPAGTVVNVSCSLSGATRYGSRMANTLFSIPPVAVALPNAHYSVNQSVIPWKPLATAHADVVEVKLTDNSGNDIFLGTNPIILEVAIRRI